MTKIVIQRRDEWRSWVTPKPLASKPIHRWCIFPHSFASEIVQALIDEWNLGAQDHVLDPFAGAGTTLLAAKERAVPSTGYDLSPFAVLATSVKLADYDLDRLEKAWEALQGKLDPDSWDGPTRVYPELVQKALPGGLLKAFHTIDRDIDSLAALAAERDFFRLALLTTIPRYSHAIATGGWLSWVDRQDDVAMISSEFSARVQLMLDDVRVKKLPRGTLWQVKQADARALPDTTETYSGVISSPPYPNRHDYTRVFGVELMFGFLDWDATRKLRYQNFHSHPEAHPERPEPNGYRQPAGLSQVLKEIEEKTRERRIAAMLAGYFLDMYLCLREVRRVCKRNARIAFVVGNAQYYGRPILVDELTAEIGEQAGLTCTKLLAVRFRGNSAQQMGQYGRNPSRESIVVFSKDT